MAILRPTPRQVLRAGAFAILLLVAAALTACFNPEQPGCAFSCASDGLCPSGYFCSGDMLCHRSDGQGTCAISTDAGSTDANGQ